MAVATMSTFAPSASSAMGVFVPSTPMVVKREKRRRRRNAPTDTTAEATAAKRSRRNVRQGFVFDSAAHDDETERPPVTSTASSASSAFVFRVRKSPASGVDAAHATEALLQKQERARARKEKRQRLVQRQQQKEKDAALEATLDAEQKLSKDQWTLYYAVRDQVKREMRKTMRDFARSAARADILQLTEKSLEAIKVGVANFLTANPPSQTMEIVPNPENARLKALIESYEARIQDLEKEETKWTSMRETLEAATVSDVAEEATERKQVELSVTTEIGNLQKAVITEVETSAQQLSTIQDSMKSIDRLALQAEIQKAKLFDAYHGSAFKGYERGSNESLRALLKLVPSSK